MSRGFRSRVTKFKNMYGSMKEGMEVWESVAETEWNCGAELGEGSQASNPDSADKEHKAMC